MGTVGDTELDTISLILQRMVATAKASDVFDQRSREAIELLASTGRLTNPADVAAAICPEERHDEAQAT